MGAAQPQVLAHQLALLIDGAIVAAMVSRDPGVADTAGLAAGNLFGPSKVKKPKRAGTLRSLSPSEASYGDAGAVTVRPRARTTAPDTIRPTPAARLSHGLRGSSFSKAT